MWQLSEGIQTQSGQQYFILMAGMPHQEVMMAQPASGMSIPVRKSPDSSVSLTVNGSSSHLKGIITPLSVAIST